MDREVNRRDFLKTIAAASAGVMATPVVGLHELTARVPEQVRPVVIASANGLAATDRAMSMIERGVDALSAVIAGVNIAEEDPNDMTVGYGGLPNEDGVVELDAAVMEGPTHRAGAVAAIRNIKTPSKVARLVMERTDHVLIVGEGALRFAKAHGFKEEDLLTERSREAWLKWKENLSTKDDWLPPHTPQDSDISSVFKPYFRHDGSISCSALDRDGNLSAAVTTSGLKFKIPGRTGDLGIIGAGIYVDNDVGAAGSTGRGEANLINCSSVMIVEYMMQGKSPEKACLSACQRIVDHNRMRRLRDDAGRPNFDVKFYAVNKRGEYGSASIWSGGQYALHDGRENKLRDSAYLFKKKK
ncbi:MAG: N(4)-(beta-N-acetylglucosaminyl)-L-asparaginase [Bacteroidota bacterium]